MAILQAEQVLARKGVLAKLDTLLDGLGPIVHRCLRSAPEDRIGSAGDLAGALADLASRAPRGPQLIELVRVARGEDSAPAPMGAAVVTLGLFEATNVADDEDRFVGRVDELQRLTDAFEQGSLVTVTGPGGTGKTRLARTWALRHSTPFQEDGGVWIVSASEVEGLAGLVDSVVAVLQIGPAGDSPEAASVALGRAMHCSRRGPRSGRPVASGSNRTRWCAPNMKQRAPSPSDLDQLTTPV